MIIVGKVDTDCGGQGALVDEAPGHSESVLGSGTSAGMAHGSNAVTSALLVRLRHIALRLTRRFDSLPGAMSIDDLVHEGWLAHAVATGEPAWYRWQRVVWAMRTALHQTRPFHLSGEQYRVNDGAAVALWRGHEARSYNAAHSLVRRWRLTRGQQSALRAACGRVLTGAQYRLMIALWFDDETVGSAAALFGWTVARAGQERSRALVRLRTMTIFREDAR